MQIRLIRWIRNHWWLPKFKKSYSLSIDWIFRIKIIWSWLIYEHFAEFPYKQNMKWNKFIVNNRWLFAFYLWSLFYIFDWWRQWKINHLRIVWFKNCIVVLFILFNKCLHWTKYLIFMLKVKMINEIVQYNDQICWILTNCLIFAFLIVH